MAATNMFKVGDLVMFKNRTQITTGGMPVERIDTNMFDDTLLMVNGAWWRPGNFISYGEWAEQCKQNKNFNIFG